MFPRSQVVENQNVFDTCKIVVADFGKHLPDLNKTLRLFPVFGPSASDQAKTRIERLHPPSQLQRLLASGRQALRFVCLDSFFNRAEQFFVFFGWKETKSLSIMLLCFFDVASCEVRSGQSFMAFWILR